MELEQLSLEKILFGENIFFVSKKYQFFRKIGFNPQLIGKCVSFRTHSTVTRYIDQIEHID